MTVLEGRDLVKRYRGSEAAVEALRGVDFRLEDGEILGVAGESGSGKSTLLKLVAGLEPPTAGTLLLHGQPLRFRRAKAEYRRQSSASVNVTMRGKAWKRIRKKPRNITVRPWRQDTN